MKVIPIRPVTPDTPQPLRPEAMPPAGSALSDRLGRELRELRISITDRCNFRCVYCMPREVFDREHAFLPRRDLLSFEEITRLVRIFAARGVRKIRLTGGEPLLRKGVEGLVAMLADIGGLELTLTTNGILLPRMAERLAKAGLNRVTVSLDALDEATFRRVSDTDYSVGMVLAGIQAAAAAGLGPVKVNMVVKRGANDQDILPMARHFRHSGHILRFIEYMDVGSSNGWRLDEVLPSREVLARIGAEFPLKAVDHAYNGEVAERWRYADGAGEIGVISSVTQAFCSSCTRLRLSTEGKLYTCLFADQGHDLRRALRAGEADNATLERRIAGVWLQRGDRYSETRSAATPELRRKIEMSYIGG